MMGSRITSSRRISRRRHRFKDTGGSRDIHEKTQEPHKPTSKPSTPHTDSRARPHPNPGTHASPHTTHPIKRGGGDGDGDGARTWEQRGREPDGIGDGTPPRTGGRGGKRLDQHQRAADRAHGSCPAARTGHDYRYLSRLRQPRPAPSLSVESLRVESGKGIGMESRVCDETVNRAAGNVRRGQWLRSAVATPTGQEGREVGASLARQSMDLASCNVVRRVLDEDV